MKINKKYLTAFLTIFFVELFIAVFVKDRIIRPYIGDILVIILIYTFLRTFILKYIKYLALYIFIFACLVEVGQYFNLVELLNIDDNIIARIIIGSIFDIKDIICYFIGMIIIFAVEKLYVLKIKG